MPFSHKAAPCRAYRYGARIHDPAAIAPVLDQMRARVRLWNALVEIDHRVRAERDQRIRDALGDLAEDKAARKVLFAEPAFRDTLKAADAEAYEEAKALGHAAPLWWCNRDDVLQTWLQHRRDPRPLQFHSSREGGKLVVRRSGGWPVETFLAGEGTSHLTLTRLDTSGMSRKAQQAQPCTLRFGVGSDGRAPLTATVTVYLHRPLPPGTIQRAELLMERVGTHLRWSVVFVVALAAPPIVRDVATPRRVALDLGWRMVPDGLRVAVWRDDQGRDDALVLPYRWMLGLRKADDLRSIRDDQFNAARQALVAWIAEHGTREWMMPGVASLPKWRSPARLAALTLRWRDHREDGDAAIVTRLETWRQHDKHLYEYEANSRDELLTERREWYRCFAKRLAQDYDEVALEDVDWRKLAQSRDLPEIARRHRVYASPSILTGAIRNAMAREGGTVTTVPAPHTTHICAHCGSLERFDAAAELVHVCGGCGVGWDQDANAARIVLARAVPPQTDTAA